MKILITLFFISLSTLGASLSDQVPFRAGNIAEIHLNILGVKVEKPSSKIEDVFFDYRAPNSLVAEVFYTIELTEGEKQEIRNFYIELIEEEFKDMKISGGQAKVELNKQKIVPSKK